MNDKKFNSLAKVTNVFVRPLLHTLIVALLTISLAACSNDSSVAETVSMSAQPTKEAPVVTQASGSIYLYGETHGNTKTMDKEYELWSNYYRNNGMRHLFIERSYFTAEYLNLWMQSDNDDILEEIYADSEGTQGHTPYTKTFYKKIKTGCPETIFHGTDVGHQRDTTGSRYLSYLAANDLTGSEQYNLTTEAIQQGEFYYSNNAEVYRENKMTENFIREFEQLGSESIMGIYGSAHTGLDAMEYSTQSVPCMANQLRKHYGDNVHSEDLSWIVKDIKPSRVDHITLQGKKYAASYFGKQGMSGFKDYAYREFWRLEGAYADVKDLPLVEDVLPYDEYPMLIKKGQVFAISYTKADGSVTREYHLSNGKVWKGMESTQHFTVD